MQVIAQLKRNSSFKLFLIILITLALLIPLAMVEGTIHERSQMRFQAESSISARWGARQHLSTPVLMLPYKEKIVTRTSIEGKDKIKITYIDHIAYVLADKANISTQMTTEIRYLGIYEMPVYTSSSRISGHFSQKDLSLLNKRYKRINWSKAKLVLPIEDVRGIKSISSLQVANLESSFIPHSSERTIFKGIEAPVKLTQVPQKDIPFSLQLSLSGSKQLNYLPLARHTRVNLQSDWNNPSFSGAYLPAKRNIDNTGTQAQWSILGLNRSFGQSWHDSHVDMHKIEQSAFGMALYQPADIYQQNLRSVKYAVLFIALTFMAFFLFEIFYGLNIHPVQYFFTGGALSTFYLLLLALSEHMHFSIAYLCSSVAIVLLMSGYSMSILKQHWRGLLIGLITSLIYSFLFFLVQSEQNALLFGAIGFFITLASMMYLTRHIDWYQLSTTASRQTTNE